MKKLESLASIREECQLCKMCVNCAWYDSKGAVFADGNPKAKIMIIGQNPGEKEDDEGKPFVGPSGQFLDKCLESAKLIRQNDVYITNAVKCHTKSNEPPKKEMYDPCREYLNKQIDIIDPKVIICLGVFARKAVSMILLNQFKKLSSNIQESNCSLDLFKTDNIAKLEHIPNLYTAWALKKDYGFPIVVVISLIHPSGRSSKPKKDKAYNSAFKLAKEYAELQTNDIEILEARLHNKVMSRCVELQSLLDCPVSHDDVLDDNPF